MKRYRLLRGVEARLALLLGKIFWGEWCKPQRDDMIEHIQSWMSDCASAIQSAYRGRASRKIYNRIMAKFRRKVMYKRCVVANSLPLASQPWPSRDVDPAFAPPDASRWRSASSASCVCGEPSA